MTEPMPRVACEKRAPSAGVIHTEPGALVQELLPGKALTAAEVKAALAPDGDAPLLKALASTLRKLHGAPMPPDASS